MPTSYDRRLKFGAPELAWNQNKFSPPFFFFLLLFYNQQSQANKKSYKSSLQKVRLLRNAFKAYLERSSVPTRKALRRLKPKQNQNS